MDHPWPILFIIVAGFAMLDVAFCYQHYINRVCERDPSATGPACEFGWTSGWEAYDPGDSAVPARNPRRANAKELRRAYERARQELKTIELEARPKSDRKPDLHAIEQVHLRRERRADHRPWILDDGVGHP